MSRRASRRSRSVVDSKRRVIGKARVTIDGTTLEPFAERRGDELVIDAPADVTLTRTSAVRPPSVVLPLGIERAVAVHPAVFVHQRVHPRPLVGQAARVFLIAAPVPDVLLAAHDVPVAADDMLALAPPELLQVRQKGIHEALLGGLAMLAGGTRRQIQRHHGEPLEAGFEIASLAVEFVNAKSLDR